MRRTISGIAAVTVAGVLTVPTSVLGQVSTAAPADAPPDSSFQKVTLNDRPGEPMDLAVLPDNSVLHTTREGTIWHNDAKTGVNSVAGTIDVYRHDEEGLQSIALQPGFDGKKKNWVYLYYSPPQDTPVDDPATPDLNEGDAPWTGTPEDFAPFKGDIRLSRFRFADGEIQPRQRAEDHRRPGRPRHLLPRRRRHRLRLGRQPAASRPATTPTRSSPTATCRSTSGPTATPPSTRSAARPTPTTCAARSCGSRPRPAAATPSPRATSSSPGPPKTRPEIYAMGLRNPFRIEIDPRTDTVFVGDYSPDARTRRPGARPGRPRPVGEHREAGELRLALLRDTGHALRRLRLRHRHLR